MDTISLLAEISILRNRCENYEKAMSCIRTEIEQKAWEIATSDTNRANGMWDAYRIIDKYIVEE